METDNQTNNQKRAWEPFKPLTIRLSATNKMVEEDKTGLEYGRRQARTKANALDTVRGCPGAKTNNGRGCPWGCYMVETMRRFHKIMSQPVSNILDEHLLHKDLDECKDAWVRIGVNGDPGENWDLTARVCEIVNAHNKDPIVVSRLWTMPTERDLARLERANVVLHISVCALDNDAFLETRLKVLNQFKALGGKAVMRLVTFKFSDPSLNTKQDRLYTWGGAVLEQPARLQRTNPNYALVDKDAYKPYHDYVDGKPNPRWLCANQLYKGPFCGAGCPKCENACMAKVLGHIPPTAPIEAPITMITKMISVEA